MKLSAIILGSFKFTVAVVVFILTIELCARIDDALKYDADLWQGYSSDSLKGSDSDGISRNIPKSRFQKWQNNSYGFRGPEVTPNKVPGTTRIICLGASESYGLYESPGKEWPAQLRSLLPRNKYEVINVSVVGLGLRSYEAYLKKYVLKLEPDIIISFINPLFYASGYEKKQLPQDHPQSTQIKKATKKPASLVSTIIANSRSLPKLKQVIKQALQSNFPNMLKRYQLKNMQNEIRAAEVKHLGGSKPKDSVAAASVASFNRDISDFVSSLQSRHISVVLATYPALMARDNLSVYPDIFLDNRRFFIGFSLLGMVDILEKYNSVIRAVAVEYGAKLADCQVVVPKTERYFGDNVHYTDYGARIVAETVAKQILEKSGDSVSKPPATDTKLH